MRLFLFFLVLSFSGCNGNDKDTKQDNFSSVLPEKIYQNVPIEIHAIEDSIGIDDDSLFFHVELFLEDLSVRKGFVRLREGRAVINIPDNAVYLVGQFYNLHDSDTVLYERIIYNNRNKPALNAIYIDTEEKLREELLNYPDNITAYANYVSYLKGQYHKGKISDTLYRERALIYLDSAKAKFNSESALHISAMARLYAYTKNFEMSQKHILKLLNKYPNSNFLNKSIGDYTSTLEFGEVKSSEELFFDSLMKQISDKYPHSFTGMNYSQGYYNFISKDYKDRDIIYNNMYWMNNIDSTRTDFIG